MKHGPSGYGANNNGRGGVSTSDNVGIGTTSPDSALDVSGAISSGIKGDSSPDGTDVSGVNILTVSTGAGSQTINGLVGGVTGQVLHIVKTNSAFTLTLANDNGGANQSIITNTNANISVAPYGGWTLVFDGTVWREVGD